MTRLIDANIGGARFTMNLQRGFEDLVRVVQGTNIETIRQVLETAGFRAANILKEEVSRLYREGVPGHPKLHPFTIAMKGQDQPLYETGSLAEAVRVRFIQRKRARTDFEVSIKPGVNQIKAAIAEEGAILRVTPARRRFLASRGLRLRSGTRFLFIPPRPVFPVAIENSRKLMQETMQRDINRALGKVFRV